VLLVAFRRSRLLRRRAVITQTIRLDDQVVIREEEVRLVAEDPMFRQRQREAGGESQGPEENLQVGVGEAEGVAVEHRP